nr:MAG TPA: hypothetical protein [Caudoviricetes sp.]
MRKLVEYHIVSGRCVETRRCILDVSPRTRMGRKSRSKRIAGNSSARKIAANEKEAVRRLARIINCNFRAGDLWLQLKYSDERLPEDMEAAKKEVSKFLRNVGSRYRKETGKSLRYVLTTSDTDPRTGKKVRLHHHLVMDRAAWEVVTRYWPEDQCGYTLLDGRGDYTGIARYMVSNACKDAHAKKWSSSRGLEKPIYTEPVIVRDVDGIQAPEGALVKEKTIIDDEETGLRYGYVRAVMPDRPSAKRMRLRL